MSATETQRHRETERDPLTEQIIAAAIEVHKTMGPGLLESVYEDCLCHEFTLRGVSFRRQVPLHLAYKGLKLDATYRIDILVEDTVIVEIKAGDTMLPVFRAQVLSYLRLSGKKVALLINFHQPYVTGGIERFVS